MIRKPVEIDPARYPDVFLPYLEKAKIYDSSCSPEAIVIFVDKDCGYYLKTAPKRDIKKRSFDDRVFCRKRVVCKGG